MESNNVDGLPGFGPLREATVFLDYLKGFPNPSQAEKVVYPLKEVLLLSLLAVLANASNKNGDASLCFQGLRSSPSFRHCKAKGWRAQRE